MKTLYTLVVSCALLCTSTTLIAQSLNSYSSARAVVFLDFDGQTVNGTSWNSNGPVNCAPSGLNSTQITEVFNRIAEDYRPFNVNITTDSSRYFAAPATQRIRIILTTSYEWYGAAGGVAFLNSFSWGDNTPAFVFTSLLGYAPKNVAEAGSHEAGHSMGLRHQAAYDNNCSKVADYNSGVGTGEISWAPIMGSGYSRNLTLWNKGADPTGCASIQDDLGIITGAQNGFGYRTDDHSNVTSTATTATFNNMQFNLKGIIEKNNDVDLVKFNIPLKGGLRVDVLPFSVTTGNGGSNLDLLVELLDNNGNVLNTYNPATQLNATIDTTLNEGNYYIRIKGSGNSYTSNYASLGSYTLMGNYQVTAILPLHKFELNGTTERGAHKLNWEIVADEKVVEQVIETSTDGTTFSSLSNAGTSARVYNYLPQATGTIYYRVNVRFDNGKQHYSNVIALKNERSTSRAFIVGNMVRSTITITSTDVFSYTIYDFNGRTIAKGHLAKGQNFIPASALANGMHIIQYSGNNQQYSEKFLKQ